MVGPVEPFGASMPLKLSLKPGEKFVLNGAVLANGDKRISLVLRGAF